MANQFFALPAARALNASERLHQQFLRLTASLSPEINLFFIAL
jgi:hypothetical protein